MKSIARSNRKGSLPLCICNLNNELLEKECAFIMHSYRSIFGRSPSKIDFIPNRRQKKHFSPDLWQIFLIEDILYVRLLNIIDSNNFQLISINTHGGRSI